MNKPPRQQGFGPAGAFQPPPPKTLRFQPQPGEPVFIPGNHLRNREILYRLIISQLFYDGYQQVAVQLSNMIQADPPCPPSERLLHVAELGLEKEVHLRSGTGNKGSVISSLDPKDQSSGLDLEFEHEIAITVPEPGLYETAYVTAHKGNCRAASFSHDGELCATGSADASIKILDVSRMLAKSTKDMAAKGLEHGHPVIRTLYDHMEEVTCLDFHPREAVLASGSKDFTVKLFDFSKATAKKAIKTFTDAEQINTLSFHPSGDFIVVGTEQPVVRMYDANTGSCFVGSIPGHQHTKAVTCVKWSPDGKYYVTSSADGAIKLWDGVSSRCVSTFSEAHDKAEVCSVMFTKNGKYVLSSGLDSKVKLWELSTTRCLIAYTGAGTTGQREHRGQAVFNHTEDFVLFPDEATTSLCCWESRNALRKQLLSLGHNGAVRCIVHSPTDPAFLTCSDDFRARFWFKKRSR